MTIRFDTPPIEHDPDVPPHASLLWLHGLGADGHDFEPVVPYLGLPPGVRFVFPHAPRRAVTVNGGMVMRAWYDLAIDGRGFWQNPQHIEESRALVAELLDRERARGIPGARILLAGFSQGGAIALHTGLKYPHALGGIVALSAPVPQADALAAGIHPRNRATPVFLGHGEGDQLIPTAYAEAGRDRLRAAGVVLEWHSYAMGHEVNALELADLARWLGSVLFRPGSASA